jgi:hypothetical protein
MMMRIMIKKVQNLMKKMRMIIISSIDHPIKKKTSTLKIKRTIL